MGWSSRSLALLQRHWQAVFESLPEARNRLNSLFMGAFFIGGALGSWAVMAVFTHYG